MQTTQSAKTKIKYEIHVIFQWLQMVIVHIL